MIPTHPEGFLALPASASGKPVLILHAWWGLNDTLRAFCQRLASEGYNAFAPDLYHGQIADSIPAAEALGQALDGHYQEARQQIRAAARYHASTHGNGANLAVIGFSLGAYYALDLAASAPDLVNSVTIFYGTGGGDFSTSRAAYLGHFAGNDPYEPPAGVDDLEATLRKAGRSVVFHRYPYLGHWFCEPDRSDAYNPKAATLAWQRTLGFLRQTFQG